MVIYGIYVSIFWVCDIEKSENTIHFDSWLTLATGKWNMVR